MSHTREKTHIWMERQRHFSPKFGGSNVQFKVLKPNYDSVKQHEEIIF